ncbi:MAG: PSD1 domain-containing protein [Rubripirellula sp.]|nr:PSD1 domain-containing protein [Rubripirellula sp.]
MRYGFFSTAILFLMTLLFCLPMSVATAQTNLNSAVDFNQTIRPILSDHCFACHGPDSNDRQADLRLDTADGLQSILDSEERTRDYLLDRIHSKDPDSIMPPPEFQKPLSREQKNEIEQWVMAGASIEKPWAFNPPNATAAPPNIQSNVSGIDYFIQKMIETKGLTKNPPASPPEILRRLCLDLTGLPPNREQINRFLDDSSDATYHQLVDELLQSPHFGEHFGRYWLDLVRYGDTHGLHLDNYREMWPYRDWVIDAFNHNLSFDQFITQQLAGDLLPQLGDRGLIASGFNRLNVTTNEGGSIYEEVFARNVIDRTDAFGTIFLGLTVGCAVCHDHKFDPISQRDYYSLSAFFNSLDGRAMDGNTKDPAPVIRVATSEQESLIAEYDQSIQDFKQERQGPIESVDQAQIAWERSLTDQSLVTIQALHPDSVESAAKATMEILEDGSVKLVSDAGDKDTTTIIASIPEGNGWQTLHLEALVESEESKVGVSPNGNVVLTEITIEVGNPELDQPWVKIPTVYALADIEQKDGPFEIRYAIDGSFKEREGWAVAGHQNPGERKAWFVFAPLDTQETNQKIRVQLHYQSVFAKHQFKRIKLSLSDSNPSIPESQQITLGPVFSAGPFPIESTNPGYARSFASQGQAFQEDEMFSYQDQIFTWNKHEELTPVAAHELPTVVDRSSALVLYQNLQSPKPQKVTLLCGTDDGLIVFLNGKEVSNRRGPRELNPLDQEIELDLRQGSNDLYLKVINHEGKSEFTYAYRSPAIPLPTGLVDLVKTPAAERGSETNSALRQYYRHVFCLHPDWIALLDLEKGTRKAKEALEREIATTLIWKETKEPRAAHILIRGQYDQPGDAVDRDTPDFLGEYPSDAPKNRLGLAQWLTSDQHPLTARVAVNRFWQQIFGTGLVKTSEDFGSQGQPPSHPELLDWLAVDFQSHNWDVKRLIKMMVTSETYRTSHQVTPELLTKDPYNRFLARGPRHRLDAEILRDQALFLSGLLIDQQGGPSVKPPQPEGLWAAVGYSGSNTVRFQADQGDKIYRRSVYTFWKRTSPPPQMSMLDAPSRESCTARRERTNTPLQALLLLNEQQFLEAAKNLADRVQKEAGDVIEFDRIRWAFQTVTARLPSDAESHAIDSLLQDSKQYYRELPKLCEELVGENNENKAAWTLVCNTLLNLDEVVSK